MIILCFSSFEQLIAQEQIVQGDKNISELRVDQVLQLDITYDATSSAKTAGLGLRLHFDSDVVSLGELTSRLTEGVLPFQIKDDTTNLDNNTSTDKYFLTAWADTSGQGWPYESDLPVTLYSLPITAKENFDGTIFEFSAYTAIGYSLSANNIGIALAMKPVISLIGQSEISLELGTSYTDAGATASDNIDGDITGSIIISSDVDVNNVGTYSVTYNVSDTAGNLADEVTRVVNITPDVTKPIITLSGDAEVSLEVGTAYNDSGATASDNIDGDITSSIVTANNLDISTVGTYLVTYNVSDAASNPADEVTRVVNITPDVTKPIITINGGDIDHEQGTSYTDLGATASDNIDGDITSSISVENNVDSDTAGTYTVVYSVSDSSGNAADQKTRTVVVSDTTKPIITLVGDSEINLLIDDVYVDNGAIAFDNIDGDITERIITINLVDTSQFGEYFITYNVKDSSDNEASEVVRLVSVGGTLDVDGNGQYDALSDGLLILRSMFGLQDDALIAGTIGSGATFEAAEEIEAQIDLLGALLDIDKNGSIDALTDGLLTLRYLFGLEGDTLINGVVAADATRTTAEEIEAHLEVLMPVL
mgnify:CR=1 FL=1